MKACDDEETCFFWYYRFCSKVSIGPSLFYFGYRSAYNRYTRCYIIMYHLSLILMLIDVAKQGVLQSWSLEPLLLFFIEKLNEVIKELVKYKEEEKEMLNGIIRNC
ncbi:hypothetical protein Hanom_Chr12g01074281 [Helianthus anomalus]